MSADIQCELAEGKARTALLSFQKAKFIHAKMVRNSSVCMDAAEIDAALAVVEAYAAMAAAKAAAKAAVKYGLIRF